MLVCMGVGRIFPGQELVDFSKRFSREGQKWWNMFFTALETKKIAFFAEIFKFLPPFRYPCLWVGKISCHTIKNLV